MGFGRGILLWLLGIPPNHHLIGTVLAPLGPDRSFFLEDSGAVIGGAKGSRHSRKAADDGPRSIVHYQPLACATGRSSTAKRIPSAADQKRRYPMAAPAVRSMKRVECNRSPFEWSFESTSVQIRSSPAAACRTGSRNYSPNNFVSLMRNSSLNAAFRGPGATAQEKEYADKTGTADRRRGDATNRTRHGCGRQPFILFAGPDDAQVWKPRSARGLLLGSS